MRPALLCPLLLLACDPTEAMVGSSLEATSTHVDRLDVTPPEATVTFRADWNIVRSAPFVEGGKVRVAYDAARLPACRGEQNGRPAWAITGYAQVNDGPVQTFEAGGLSPSNGTVPPVIDLPRAGRVAFWFQVTNVWGCQAWDSNFGNNFVFEVAPQPRLVFGRDWSETVIGMPGAAPTVLIDYDLSRLPRCRATYNGFPTWDISVFWRFDGGPVTDTSVTQATSYERHSTPTPLAIPPGAKELELWFKSGDRGSCQEWDSDFGRNYRWRVN